MRARIVSVVFAVVLVAVGAADASAGKGGCPGSPPCPPVPPGPVAVGRLVTSGFETGSISGESATSSASGTGVVNGLVSDITRTGAFSLRQVSGGGGSDTYWTEWAVAGVLGRTYFLRTYLYVAALAAGSAQTIFDVRSGAAQSYTVTLATSGNLRLVRAGTNLSPVTTLVTGQWYRVELSVNIATGNDAATLRVDGVDIATDSGVNTTDVAISALRLGSSGIGGAADVRLDDFAVNDDQGASQNTYPGEGKVVLLVPTADSARGTGWTTDSAGATNFFAATDNTPPTGIADTTAGSGLHQIRNATSNASSNYDATMTTYTAAGIAAVDTINVIDPITATGAPVVTSAKAGTVGVVSNPTIANVALGAGGTAGAFWSGVAAGTYPTGWKISHGTTTYAPSVTVGTAPVMRVTQVTSSTRIAIVCFMGIYVDYTPGLLAYTSPYPPMLAQ